MHGCHGDVATLTYSQDGQEESTEKGQIERGREDGECVHVLCSVVSTVTLSLSAL